ncbi:hypothetical protein Pelo_10868 [Pelomyxa schiedti]|nr:hypothetical protein Pelo_10868 [Pelomyxa schiedti]
MATKGMKIRTVGELVSFSEPRMGFQLPLLEDILVRLYGNVEYFLLDYILLWLVLTLFLSTWSPMGFIMICAIGFLGMGLFAGPMAPKMSGLMKSFAITFGVMGIIYFTGTAGFLIRTFTFTAIVSLAHAFMRTPVKVAAPETAAAQPPPVDPTTSPLTNNS